MEEIELNLNSVKKSNQLKLELSEKIYKINKENLESEESRILKKVNCTNLNEYFKQIKKIIEDDKFSNKIFVEKEMFKDLAILKKEIKLEYNEILSEFQNIITFKILKKNIFNKLIYLPCFIDNRGRQYFTTLISPTFHKIFRYLYKFHENKEFIKLENSEYYKKIMGYEEHVKEFSLNSKNSYIALVLFLEVGKHFIKNSNEFIIKTEFIIKCGIDNYKNRSKIDFSDILYLEKIYSTLDELLSNSNIDINTILFKDATSSGLQNYGIILGYKEDKLKFINLDGND
jgi:hypothetical protein